MKKDLCIYCGQNPGGTLDHVPPRCFFEKSSPGILITVPCCETCRRADESGDVIARNLIISAMGPDSHQVVQNELADKRDRAFNEKGQLPPVAKHMVPVQVHSPGGIYLGDAIAFNFDSPVMNAFLLRVVRALRHKETMSGFVPSKIIQWRPNPTPDAVALLDSLPTHHIGEIFSYRVLFSSPRQKSLWLLTFYNRLHFLIELNTCVDYAKPDEKDQHPIRDA